MKYDISFKTIVQKFPGSSGWVYITVPKKYTLKLKQYRKAWGMYPITANVGDTTWNTKLMMKKGGDFFVALRADIRKKEKIVVGKKYRISFKLL